MCCWLKQHTVYNFYIFRLVVKVMTVYRVNLEYRYSSIYIP